MPPGRARGPSMRAATRPRLGLLAVGLVIVGLTFALGVLVGRQWVRPTSPLTATGEVQKRPAPAGRKSGLVDAEPESSRDGQDKLTFYQTLTAPLSPARSFARPGGEGTPKAGEVAAGRERPKPEDKAKAEPKARAGDGLTVLSAGGAADAAVPAGPRSLGGGSWTVQVGVFRTRPPADAVQKQLRDGGFEASVATVSTPDGQARYRVRVGAFKSRAEAERVAGRIRAERSLPTYVAN